MYFDLLSRWFIDVFSAHPLKNTLDQVGSKAPITHLSILFMLANLGRK